MTKAPQETPTFDPRQDLYPFLDAADARAKELHWSVSLEDGGVLMVRAGTTYPPTKDVVLPHEVQQRLRAHLQKAACS